MSAVVDNKGLQAPSPFTAFIKKNMQLLVVIAALVVILVFFSLAEPKFASTKIYLDIVLQAAFTGVMALGATFVIATGGIDLSVGTGLSFVAVMAGVFLAGDKMNLPLGVGLVLTILVGAGVGLINGLNVSILGLPPFIATLAMMMVARGLALVISQTQSIKIKNPDYMALATGTLIPHVANAALIFVLLTILATFLMNKTLLGRYALAIGSNEEATRLSGVNVRLWKIIIYVVAGVFMAIGAVLYSARLGLVQPAEGVGMEPQRYCGGCHRWYVSVGWPCLDPRCAGWCPHYGNPEEGPDHDEYRAGLSVCCDGYRDSARGCRGQYSPCS